MREYGVRKCECGRYIAYKPSIHFMWTVAQTGKLENTQGDDPGFCAGCNMKFGIDERGPWREAMVPRAALEWLARKRMWAGCPGEWDCEAYCREDCRGTKKEETACWIEAALKAAEEGSDE